MIGYCSVTVYFDPLPSTRRGSRPSCAPVPSGLDVSTVSEGPLVEVPVCYGGELGPDLADVAAFAGCSEADVIAAHTGRDYRVYMVGFVPGFAYMAEVDPGSRRRAGPRRGRPCRRVRSRSPPDRPASIRPRPPAAGTSSAARGSSPTIPTGQSHFSSSPAIGPVPRGIAVRVRAVVTRPHCHSPRDADDGPGPRPLGGTGERRAGRRADGRVLARPGEPARRKSGDGGGARDHADRAGAPGQQRCDVRGRGRDVRADRGRCPFPCTPCSRCGRGRPCGSARGGRRTGDPGGPWRFRRSAGVRQPRHEPRQSHGTVRRACARCG